MTRTIWSEGDEILASEINANFKYGGTGADGALAISSGTTNIDLGNVAVVVLNYTSISITGTGALTFTNPHANGTIIVLKSQGDVTLTSSAAPMIDASGIGAAQGTNGFGTLATSTKLGAAGSDATGGSGGTGGVGNGSLDEVIGAAFRGKSIRLATGAGGGVGGDDGSGGGAGGRGGGGLYIECGGAFNFTTANGISIAGVDGGNGVGQVDGGGGGGAGGTFFVLYGSLIANSGTVTVSGGDGGVSGGSDAGGAGGDGSSGDSTGGDGGVGNVTNGRGGGAGGASDVGGSNGANGTNGNSAGDGGGGGGGASGVTFFALNTEFA